MSASPAAAASGTFFGIKMKVEAEIGQELHGLIGDDEVEAVRMLPIRIRGSGLNRFAIGFNGLAVLVHHLRGGKLVLLGIGGFDIAD